MAVGHLDDGSAVRALRPCEITTSQASCARIGRSVRQRLPAARWHGGSLRTPPPRADDAQSAGSATAAQGPGARGGTRLRRLSRTRPSHRRRLRRQGPARGRRCAPCQGNAAGLRQPSDPARQHRFVHGQEPANALQHNRQIIRSAVPAPLPGRPTDHPGHCWTV